MFKNRLHLRPCGWKDEASTKWLYQNIFLIFKTRSYFHFFFKKERKTSSVHFSSLVVKCDMENQPCTPLVLSAISSPTTSRILPSGLPVAAGPAHNTTCRWCSDCVFPTAYSVSSDCPFPWQFYYNCGCCDCVGSLVHVTGLGSTMGPPAAFKSGRQYYENTQTSLNSLISRLSSSQMRTPRVSLPRIFFPLFSL